MSEIVCNEFGEEWTAFQLQDKFLGDGTEFELFTCKYCDTEVSPVAIYGGDFKVAPHFRLKDSTRPHHPTECIYGTNSKVAKRRPQKPTREYKFKVALPECFVALRASKLTTQVAKLQPNQPPSEQEIRRRVQNSANVGVISNHYTTGLLKTLVDARNAAIRKIYSLPHIEKLDNDNEKAKQVFEVLGKNSLTLYGRKSDYRNAFRQVKSQYWSGSFIYYGQATVESTTDGFLLIDEESISTTTKDDSDNEKTTLTPIHVKYVCNKQSPANGMEQKTIDVLKNNEKVRWYAYGVLKLNSTGMAYELNVNQPAHIYVKK